MTKYETDPAKIDWENIENSVITSLRMLRAVWEESYRGLPPDVHEKIIKDLYIPIVEMAARFCACVAIEDEGDDA